MDELKWIKLARQGDKTAFCNLYDRYKDRLYRYAFYRLRNASDAEDAVSECVLSAWKQMGNLREAEAFPAWIFRILSACCNRLIKQQISTKGWVSLEEVPQEIQAGTESAEQRLILQDALGSLSEEERNMVLLSVVAGLKSNEIASITNLTAGSVRSSLSRSMKKMRIYMEQR